MARHVYIGTLLVFMAVAVALGAVVYQGGMALLKSPIPNLQSQFSCLLPLALIVLAGAVGLWYLWRSLYLRLRAREVAIERARTDFAATERGFAPRLIEGGHGGPPVLVNPNVAPSAITLVDVTEQPEEISEERRLAGVMGWHLSNAPARWGGLPIRPTALPIPEPEPSPWEISHVERLLLEAGETSEE